MLLQTTLAKPAPLTVRGVYGTLRRIASETGSGAAGRRQRAVMSLLRSCRCPPLMPCGQGWGVMHHQQMCSPAT